MKRRIWWAWIVGTVLVVATVGGRLLPPAGAASVTLEWTAPSDNIGVTAYDLRYSLSLITAANFSAATPAVGEPFPLAPGSLQSMLVTGLQDTTLYYFALKAGDAAGNWSGLSNVVPWRTGLAPTDSLPPTPPGNLHVIR